jgi:hypothetical protein
VVVDSERTDELGLPLVRGPFPSLTAAREDIEAARSEGAATSPLASRLAAGARPRGKAGAASKGASSGRASSGRASSDRASSDRASSGRASSTAAGGSEPPKEPAWLRTLDGAKREAARTLLARLANEGVADAEALVRSDYVGGQPALARLAISRALDSALARHDAPEELAQVVGEMLVEGRDRELGVTWRLVDGDGRPIRRLGRE